MQRRLFSAAFLSALAVSCGGSSGSGTAGGPTYVGLTTATLDNLGLDEDGIVPLDVTVDERFRDVFDVYAPLELPQGRIHLLAQAGVEDAVIRRVQAILEQHLTDLPGGASKADVVQAMVNRGALLGLFLDDAATESSNPAVAAVATDLATSFVSLPANRVVLEGTEEYMQALPALDLTFGATAQLVHQAGISVARPALAAQLDSFAAAAISAGEFTPSASTVEGLETGAFLAMVMDVHAGVHGHDAGGDGIARAGDASYVFHSRNALAAGAPGVKTWLDDFFGEEHTFQVELPADFTGTFDGLRRSANPYTSRSQYLRKIRLTGTNTAEIFAAPGDTILEGNSGNNNFKGRAGDDVIRGGGGFDTAVFNGPMADYEIRFEGDAIIVDDVFGGHEGTDTVYDVDRLQFSDQGINL